MMNHNTDQRTKTRRTKSDTSQSAETTIQTNVAKLPPELWFKIIAKMNLSIYSMVKTFPCSWHSIMTHTLFDHYSPQQSASLIVRKTYVCPNEFALVQKDISLNKFVSTKLNKFDFVTDNQYHQLNPCHGLMCFWKYDSNEDKDLFFLSNPLTAEWVKLPDAEPLSKHTIVYNGFGYSPSTNQYKIVRIWGAGFGWSPPHVNVYTVGTSGWRRIKDDSLFEEGFWFDGGYFLRYRSVNRYTLPVESNGFLHWLVNPFNYFTVCFDVGTEKLGLFQLPNFGCRFEPQIGVLNGCFTMCLHSSEVIEIWALNLIMKRRLFELGKKFGEYYRGSADWVQEIVDVDESENKCLVIHDFRKLSYLFPATFHNVNNVFGIGEKSILQSFVPSFLSPEHIMSLAR